MVAEGFNTEESVELTVVLSEIDEGIFGSIVDRLTGVFPDAEYLTQKQKWMYIIFTMLAVNILLSLALNYNKVESGVVAYLCIAVSLILFFYFVIINYIPTGILVVLALVVLSLSFLKIRSSVANGG
jgi:hypothetical protein